MQSISKTKQRRPNRKALAQQPKPTMHDAPREFEETLENGRHFFLDPVRWSAFVTALDRPANVKRQLLRLFRVDLLEPTA
jgi:Protein of unknown function (DUF1778)